MVEAPEWIRVAQDGSGQNGGFWTCAAATEASPKYIRADLVDARIAALKAENERLTKERDYWQRQHDERTRQLGATDERALAERAEGVKQIVREAGDKAIDDLIDTFGSSLGAMSMHDLADYLRRIPEAIENALRDDEKPTIYETMLMEAGASRESARRLQRGSAAPEGRQDNEPRAYIVHAPEDDYYGTGPDRLQFHPLAQHDMDNGYRQTPLYGRPVKQAVTEAMVEAACEAFGLHERKHGLDHRQAGMRAALKAAMEAGR